MRPTKREPMLRELACDRFKTQLFNRSLSAGQFVFQNELCELLEGCVGA